MDADVICGELAHACVCVKPPGHDDGVHACRPSCGGSWSGEYGTETFDVHSWPTSGSNLEIEEST